jgi:hypothetical protein
VKKEIAMSEKLPPTQEEVRSNRFSFIVGIFIALAIIILLTLLFNK